MRYSRTGAIFKCLSTPNADCSSVGGDGSCQSQENQSSASSSLRIIALDGPLSSSESCPNPDPGRGEGWTLGARGTHPSVGWLLSWPERGPWPWALGCCWPWGLTTRPGHKHVHPFSCCSSAFDSWWQLTAAWQALKAVGTRAESRRPFERLLWVLSPTL